MFQTRLVEWNRTPVFATIVGLVDSSFIKFCWHRLSRVSPYLLVEKAAGARIGILARRPTRDYPFVSINRFFSEQSEETEKKEPNEGRNGGLFLIAAL